MVRLINFQSLFLACAQELSLTVLRYYMIQISAGEEQGKCYNFITISDSLNNRVTIVFEFPIIDV